MDETAILSAMLYDRRAYDKLSAVLNPDDFSEQGRFVCKQVQDFYQNDAAASAVDAEVIRSAAERSFPNPKHAAGITDYLEELEEPASTANIASEYLALRRYNLGLDIAAKLGRGEPADELMQRYADLDSSTTDDGERAKLPIDELFSEGSTQGSIRVFPRIFEQYLGAGLERGHNVTIFGRPESGKSMLAITFAGGFLYQGLRVLYCGNEEPAAHIQRRILSRLSGFTIPDMQRSPEARARALGLATERGYDNLAVKELTTGRVRELEALISRYKPDVLIVDQIRNLNVETEAGQAVQLDAAARAIRQLGIKHGLVTVGVTQAGNTAEGKLALTMGDIDGSKTGIPGAADLLIGVGVDERADAQHRRMITFCKNKITGRHEKFWVYCDYERSSYVSRPPRSAGGAHHE